jgi:hypothetical protein
MRTHARNLTRNTIAHTETAPFFSPHCLNSQHTKSRSTGSVCRLIHVRLMNVQAQNVCSVTPHSSLLIETQISVTRTGCICEGQKQSKNAVKTSNLTHQEKSLARLRSTSHNPSAPNPLLRTWKHAKLLIHVRFEGFTAVTMKNGVFWDVTPCGSCKNRRFGGTWRLPHQGDRNQ